jgi:hypothetical protein
VDVLLVAGALAAPAFSPRAEAVARGHAEAVGDQVGTAEHDHERLVPVDGRALDRASSALWSLTAA